VVLLGEVCSCWRRCGLAEWSVVLLEEVWSYKCHGMEAIGLMSDRHSLPGRLLMVLSETSVAYLEAITFSRLSYRNLGGANPSRNSRPLDITHFGEEPDK
jgi:hypothetical protein